MFETLGLGELVGIIGGSVEPLSQIFVLPIPQFLFIVFEVSREFFLCLTLLLYPRMGKQGKTCDCVFIVTGSRMAPPQKIPAQTIPKGHSAEHLSHLGKICIQKQGHKQKHPAIFSLTMPDERAKPDRAHCTYFSWLCFE